MKCIFCKEESLDIDEHHKECDCCWHEMRLDPNAFERRMTEIGTSVVSQNPHVPVDVIKPDGTKRTVIGSQNPYRLASEPESKARFNFKA